MAQCTAKSKQKGRRCRRPAIRGGWVCRHHGGAAPQVIAAAQRRFAHLLDPALDALLECIQSPKICMAKLLACNSLLDRAGLKDLDKVELESLIQVRDPGREVLSDERLAELIQMLGEKKAQEAATTEKESVDVSGRLECTRESKK